MHIRMYVRIIILIAELFFTVIRPIFCNESHLNNVQML